MTDTNKGQILADNPPANAEEDVWLMSFAARTPPEMLKKLVSNGYLGQLKSKINQQVVQLLVKEIAAEDADPIAVRKFARLSRAVDRERRQDIQRLRRTRRG